MIKNESITMRCELCSAETGVVLKLGDLIKQFPDLKPDGDVYLNGICQKCQSLLDEGAVFFIDANHRVMGVSVEGTKAKIDPQFWGKILKIPVGAMSSLIQTWAEANHTPPESKN